VVQRSTLSQQLFIYRKQVNMKQNDLSKDRRSFLYRTGQGAVGLASAAVVGACGGGSNDANATPAWASAAKPLAFQETTAVDMIDCGTLLNGNKVCQDGTPVSPMKIAVREYGDPLGKPILFIPGFSQNHLCFYRQFLAPELTKYRLIVMDMPGHGDSEKTLPVGFANFKGWAPEEYANYVAKVIAAKGLVKPVIVGWSYGGYMIGDYIRFHGTGNIGGLNFVGAGCRYVATAENTHNGPGFLDNGNDLLTDQSAANTRGTINFLNACFKLPISQDDFATLLATNMMVTPQVRLALVLRDYFKYDQTVFNSMNPVPPTLVTHGKAETVVLVASADAIHAAIPGSKISLYDGAGHLTFIEDSARFNRELAEFRASI
jgi:pimeloyl-ACP methyl ester carboxylesterase